MNIMTMKALFGFEFVLIVLSFADCSVAFDAGVVVVLLWNGIRYHSYLLPVTQCSQANVLLPIKLEYFLPLFHEVIVTGKV